MTKRRGLTMLELVVVTAIVTLLGAVLLPALSKAKSQAARVGCAFNLRRLGDALNLYKTDLGRYPEPGDRDPAMLGPRWKRGSPRPSRANNLTGIGDIAEALHYASLKDPRMMYCPVSMLKDPNSERPYQISRGKVIQLWRSGNISYIYLAGVPDKFSDASGNPTFAADRESPDRSLNRVNPRVVLAGDRTVDPLPRPGPYPKSNHGREGGWFYFTSGDVQWMPWDRLTPHPSYLYTWYWPRMARTIPKAK